MDEQEPAARGDRRPEPPTPPFGTPAPWDQPDGLDDADRAQLRPREHAGGVHPGWASASPEAYGAAASGGWGVPGHAETGPMPKLRASLDVPPEDDETSGRER